VASFGRSRTPTCGFVPPQKALDEIHHYFHLFGIDILISDRCERVVLELNDRPSMRVTDRIEYELKTQAVFDALNIVSVDGEDAGPKAVPGGWEKLIPDDGESMFGSPVHVIVERSCQGALASPKRLVMRRLG
jgi:hypothetical protein